jgi:hypothetical protein
LSSAALDLVEALISVQDNRHKPTTEFSSGIGLIATDTGNTLPTNSSPQVSKREVHRVQIEEVEDEYWEAEARMPKARHGVLEEMGDELEDVEGEEEEIFTRGESDESPLPPLPSREPTVPLKPKRSPKPGDSAIGISVLSVRGQVGSLEDKELDLRLDSCADITLISEEHLRSLKTPPPVREGRKMNLAQLTDGGATIKGFTKLKVFMTSTTGDILEMEAEAYVVKGMSVPILLGEDFQLNYELGVSRNIEDGTKILFKNTPFEVDATGVEPFVGRTEAHTLAANLTTHAKGQSKAKLHRRMKTRRRRRVLRNGAEGRTIRAAEDYRIRAQECRVVRVDGDFSEDKEWLVERNLLANSEDSFFSVPNTLISARKPCVPVSNMSDCPRFIRKGEILGTLTDPQDYFDKPSSQKQYETMRKHTAMLSEIIQAKAGADEDAAQPNTPKPSNSKQWKRGEPRVHTDFGSGVPPSEENARKGIHVRDAEGRVPDGQGRLEPDSEEAEDYGPKTAAMPDDTIYPSTEMEELLDVGSLPEHLKSKAWEMLRRRVKAFGFDGRLGHLKANAKIRLKEGSEPIAVPMYSSSPEKRCVIDAQLEKWFEQGVIEPSASPWSAPVVIAYRNGKPRFCVDYRKLNTMTIADEFPLPRQSEILQSLSGAQVLSSLDALSGFNQLDMAQEDVEKTAFRTHRGLAQFRRMPFGLRNGPSIFQRVMQGILSPYLWLFCLVYIDDIVVYSRSYEEHLEHLDKVLGAIEKAGVTLSPTKCHLFYSSILLLGHKVS